jgi:hypothetical protein
MNGPDKLERYITIVWKGLPGTNAQLIGPICEMLRKKELQFWPLAALHFLHNL